MNKFVKMDDNLDNFNQFSERKVRKDYQNKKFVNPYFSIEDKKDKGRFNTKFYLKILVLTLLVYVLIYSNLLRINQIQINGFEMIDEQEFRQVVDKQLGSLRYYLLPQNNFLLLSKAKLANEISAKYDLDKLEIDRSWKSLNITIEERVSFLIVYNKQSFYFADKNGIVTREITKDAVGEYWYRFPILNIGDKNVNIGNEVTSAKIVDFLLRLNEKIINNQLEINGYELREGEEINLVSRAGWRAYFDVNTNLDTSVENLFLVLNEKVEDQNTLEYIDLRFGNKVFYK